MISTIFSKSDPAIGGVTFDCIFNETMEASYESTDYSVESGAVYQDHIRKLPKMISMRVAVSDTPFAGPLGSLLATGAGYVGSKLPPLVTGIAGTTASLFNASNSAATPDTRSAAAWQAMLDAADKMDVFEVVTTKGIYQNYHIKKIYYECNPDNENSIEIIIDMKEVRTFQSNIESGQPSKIQLRAGSSESIQAAPPSKLGGLASEQI
ncbi:tail fiber protein [Vibrio phage 209E38-1]